MQDIAAHSRRIESVTTATTRVAGNVIVVHHLNNSRSQRILWLLEGLNTPWVETYRRDTKTDLAPPQLRAVHPLGKSPVI